MKHSWETDRQLRRIIYGAGGYGTVKRCGQALGVQPGVVSRWLCGRHKPTPPYLWAIGKAFALLELGGEPFVAPWVEDYDAVRNALLGRT